MTQPFLQWTVLPHGKLVQVEPAVTVIEGKHLW